MHPLLIVLYFAWALWLGSIVFFSFVVAPTVHGVLARSEAAALLQKMFPRYYLFGAICGCVALLSALTVANDLRLTVPILIAAVMSVYARQVLAPSLAAAREGNDDERFARLHVQSVRLNIVALAALILVGVFLTAI